MGRYLDTCTALGVCLVADVPVVLWGDPGQGKTSVVEQLAADLGWHLETVIASLREPSDFAGLPVVDPTTGAVSLAPPAWALRLARAVEGGAPGGIQFYDEVSTAPPSVQAALLRPVLSRWVGDLRLPDGVRTIAAANPAGVAADGWDLAPPMANRFTHLQWSLPADVVREGFALGFPRVPVPAPDPAAVERLRTEALLAVGSFLGARPDLVTRLPRAAQEAGTAFPTPRTWEMAARLLGTARAAGCGEGVVVQLLGGTVGEPAALELLEYLEHLDLPDPEDLLADPAATALPAGRGDLVYAVAAAVWSATAADATPQRWVSCGRVLARIAELGHADVAHAVATRWARARPVGAMPPEEVATALGPVLAELGPAGRAG